MNIGDSLSSLKIALLGGAGILANLGGAATTADGMVKLIHFSVASFVALATLFYLHRRDKRETEKHSILLEQHRKLMNPKIEDEESS
jgi:hypothetical protein